MLRIRLSRIGKKNKPIYRIIISERSKDPYGRALEILGTYNPYSKELLNPKKERIQYWISQGAQLTPSANNLLIDQKVITGEKVKASKVGKKNKDGETSPEGAPAPAAGEQKAA